jgi:hypothetical protein
MIWPLTRDENVGTARVLGSRERYKMNKLQLLDKFINENVRVKNDHIICIENFFGKDYDSGYHEIAEDFEKLRPLLEGKGKLFEVAPAKVVDDLEASKAKPLEDFRLMLHRMLDKWLGKYAVKDGLEIASYHNRLDNKLTGRNIDFGALKELRLIEEELDER